MKKKIFKIFLFITSLLILVLVAYMFYTKIYLEYTSTPSINIIGEEDVSIEYNTGYVEQGAKAKFRNKDISKMIVTKGSVDTSKVGLYEITYEITVHNKSKNTSRFVEVIDTKAPEIMLEGKDKIVLTIGADYSEPGYKALDDYDGDITNLVEISNNIDSKNPGNYEITYNIKDTSGNETTAKRNIQYIKPEIVVKEPPSANATATKIAVLNYHFFYDPSRSEYGGDSNYISVQNFEEQLKYLQKDIVVKTH